MQLSRHWGDNQISKEGAHKIVKACYLDTKMKEMFLVSTREHSHQSDLKGVHSSHTVVLLSKVLV